MAPSSSSLKAEMRRLSPIMALAIGLPQLTPATAAFKGAAHEALQVGVHS